jgi:Fic family protein
MSADQRHRYYTVGYTSFITGKVIKKRKYKTLREIAQEYGVSHETVRRTIKRLLTFNQGVTGSRPVRPTLNPITICQHFANIGV